MGRALRWSVAIAAAMSGAGWVSADVGCEQELTASDGQGHDHFGHSVAIDGDRAIVGAFGDHGSVYIFRRSGGAWVEEQKLTASDGQEADSFGYSVAIDGDRAIVGAFGDDDNGSRSGSAYIFRRSGGAWVEEQKLTASDGQEADSFGYSVAIDGDRAIVGAFGDDDNGSRSGSAYIFRRSGGGWVEEQKLTASDAAEDDRLGYSVGIDGDRAIVGAFGDDDNGSRSGSAYIFRRSGGGWVEEQKLTASDAAAGDNFGDSVAIDGEFAIVGAPFDNLDKSDHYSGSAYIFHRSGSAWVQQQRLFPTEEASHRGFGECLAIDGTCAIIGLAWSGNDIAAYLFRRSGTMWEQEQKFYARSDQLPDFSVAIDGGYAIVGESVGGVAIGSAYTYCIDAEVDDEPAGQDEEPEYGDYTPPSPEVNKLVIITHGINTSQDDFEEPDQWAMQLKAAIEAKVADDPSWEVRARWTVETATPWSVQFANLGSGDGASIASDGYEHVHLIGHSAGAWFMDACAKQIRELRGDQTTIHCTYLDPACVVPFVQRAYRGMTADYAENYFSRQGSALACGIGDALSGGATQVVYDHCFNIDISQLDPDYDDDGWVHCLSDHQWPHCFYRLSADADVSGDAECDTISGDYEPYGFDLARENYSSELGWLGVVSQFPEGNDPALELPENPGFRGAGGGESNYITFDRLDDPLDLTAWPSVAEGDVATANTSVTLTSPDADSPAWLNIELTPNDNDPVNIVQLHLDPGTVTEAVGLLTVLLDGEQIGIVDERHMPGEGDTFVFGTERIAPPGETLILSIRLDTIYAGLASMTASSIRTGLSDIRWHCLADLASNDTGQGDLDGVVDLTDLEVILFNWGVCTQDCVQWACPGDIDLDCRVGVLDLIELLMTWGPCE